jgi:phage gp36-like protein
MPYATQADILERYGEDVLYALADRNRDGTLDEEAISRALVDATAEIDSYLASRYPLPLSATPKIVVILCADIALYRLSPDHVTEERRKRYEDAVKMLRLISDGKMSLGIETQDSPVQRSEISVQAPSRIFTSDVFSKM